MLIKWFKDRDGSLWFNDFEGKTIYVIFDIKSSKEYCVGVYHNVRISKKDRILVNDKPFFYDGFNLKQAKELVKNIVEVKSEKINSVKRIERSNKKRINN